VPNLDLDDSGKWLQLNKKTGNPEILIGGEVVYCG
jgi:hypothetical protein